MEQNGSAFMNGSTENWNKFPFAFESIDGEVEQKIRKHFPGRVT